MQEILNQCVRNAVISKGKEENIQYFLEQGASIEWLVRGYTAIGNLEKIKENIEKCKNHDKICFDAGEYGQLEIILFLAGIKFANLENCVIGAAYGRHLDLIKKLEKLYTNMFNYISFQKCLISAASQKENNILVFDYLMKKLKN